MVQQQTEFRPESIERREYTRRGVGQHGEQHSQREPVMPALAAIVDAQRTEQCEKPGEDKPKAALGRDLNDLLPRLKLMSAEIFVLHIPSRLGGRKLHILS